MTTSSEESSFLKCLKFRAAQPVDIPRCHQLECLVNPPEVAASKSTLQHQQHHAAPFFRCVLLKTSKTKEKKKLIKLDRDAPVPDDVLDKDEGAPAPDDVLDEGAVTDKQNGQETTDEACHHVHHSTDKLGYELIGYVRGTRCNDTTPAAPLDESKVFTDEDAKEISDIASRKSDSSEISTEEYHHMYPKKHEANGKFLVIHSIVIQPEYQNLGVAKALLEYYVKQIIIYNGELDEAGKNRRRNKLKAKKTDTRIERILSLANSSMGGDLFLPLGFRWRATIKSGVDPLYEWEREVEASSSPASCPSSVSSHNNLQPHPLMEQDFSLLDSFTNPRQLMSGNPAAVVVLHDAPAQLIQDYYASVDTEQPPLLLNGNGNGSRQLMDIIQAAKAVQGDESVAEMRALNWMKRVAREFNQPCTAFVYQIHTRRSRRMSRSDSCSYFDEDEMSLSSKQGAGSKTVLDYYVRFFTQSGMELNTCAHATLAAAGLLYSQYAAAGVEEDFTLSFHSRQESGLEASLVSHSSLDESYRSGEQVLPAGRSTTQAVSSSMQPNSVRVAVEYPWRTVEPVPPGPDGQGAVLAMLRRAFFSAWSVVSADENDDDKDTDELAFSFSADHVLNVCVTSEGEDLLVELTECGFNLLSNRNVDHESLKQGWNGSKGVIICCEVPDADGQSEGAEAPDRVSIDFCSRYFQPRFAHEDPASGWSHCCLGPYFSARKGKQRLFGLQTSDRGGLIECNLKEAQQKVSIVGYVQRQLAGKTLMRA